MVKEPVSLHRMQVVSWVYLAVLTVLTLFVSSWNMAWSVFAGGVISIASFRLSKKGLTKFLDSLPDARENPEQVGSSWSQSGYLLKFWIRIAIIGVILLLLIRSGWANTFGLVLGLSTIVFAVTFTAMSVVKHYYFSGRR
ncbi:ATP synthase subunit I [Desulfopila sp. IMCC35008]|uniref:ATP synthase subunit I n=1 Tax=Desulfopila sp. IMCC35008 TaxID=2653858 RepID=UPI0013D3D3A4|nr:ATP synthase subunit I [Desulfopila sp. IMCC35008]